MKYINMREEELKGRIEHDYFGNFDCNNIIGNVDFCVALKNKKSDQNKIIETESLLWAEAKKGSSDLIKSIVQLIITIGKARTYDIHLPPAFLGAFDGEKIAFIPYNKIYDIFYINDFNWNITPSNHQTKEFAAILNRVKAIIDENSLIFIFGKDDKDLINYIKANFVIGKSDSSKIKIDKNNFLSIYNKWLISVRPTIKVDWKIAKNDGIIDGDFYLADLLSNENLTFKDNLFVVLRSNVYFLKKFVDVMGLEHETKATFNDNQKAHNKFWNKYERPPKEEYWEYIIGRRDLLVPQDVRERKGSFFTPQEWVYKSHNYLKEELGENWQEEYYIWDCAAGTGNLLNGLTNKYNIWASTLDQQDVDVMKDRIKNGANLLLDHVFQFDFLNDDINIIPKPLLNVITDPKKNCKLIILINPPYAEATTARTVTGTGENKAGVAKKMKYNEFYNELIGNASNEIFALFMTTIYYHLPNSILAQFSTLKFIQGSNFKKFKEHFKAKYLSGFVVPANTFDNVKGSFPISFTIWNLNIKQNISEIRCDIFNSKDEFLGKKTFYGDLPQSLNKWIKLSDNKKDKGIGFMCNPSPDFQHNSQLYISLQKGIEHFNFWNIIADNLIYGSVYFAVRNCIEPTWLNDRDQFLFPDELWINDFEFQSDCLAFTIFHSQNKVTSKDGTNHWIPFLEKEINSAGKFDSNFLTDFINGKTESTKTDIELHENSFTPPLIPQTPLNFSYEAKMVFNCGKELWKYYHSTLYCNVNASLYDIREYFQGRNDKGKMKNKSDDETYMTLIGNLRTALKVLAKKIEPKVYEYGFLKE